jgi:hypothetical protein
MFSCPLTSRPLRSWSRLGRDADRLVAVVLVEDRDLAAGLLDRLRERARLDDVAAEVDVAEDGGVALELASSSRLFSSNGKSSVS